MDRPCPMPVPTPVSDVLTAPDLHLKLGRLVDRAPDRPWIGMSVVRCETIATHGGGDVYGAMAFAAWFTAFLPRLAEHRPACLFTPAVVSDRSDPKIAHLDGPNLSRA